MNSHEFIKKARSKKIDLKSFYQKLFKKLYEIDKKHDCLITISEEEALKQLDNLPKGKLYGLPVTVKDALCTKGIKSTAGSRILHDYKPPFDSTVVARIKAEGGVIIGKTAMDEFGFGGFSTNCAFKVPKNPFDLERSCGGSSGGAGCITQALDEPHIAIGESTGGSISCPASFCGVCGLTPTYGRVSRYGLIDYANSLDKIGPMARTVKEIALMLKVIAGHDKRDQTTRPEKVPDYERIGSIKGMTIGIPKEYFVGVSAAISDLVWKSIKDLEKKGCKIKKVSLNMTKHVVPAYYITAMSEASTNLSKLCGMRYGLELPLKGNFNEYFSNVRAQGFGQEAKRRIILGTYARMSGYRNKYYLQALKVRTLVIKDFKKAFKTCDLLAAPVMPVLAPRFDEISKLSPIENYLMDILLSGPNLAGLPMLSVPCGDIEGLPVGLHLMADHLQEQKLINAGVALHG
jgi:aspartyl-tRNA(Asn)/glutamyl-tRNA(Gln) amidotransferase subunit A